ncbi:hypothetical protein [Paractinoplanes brasiliensis]|uniref:hypothetical protein n=1 Tax=Paractinoplanes brasiliensis TaxID=52695 RepID=UPI00105E0917|nr:hypothetical protein [Actinoplanes brasiliensis]
MNRTRVASAVLIGVSFLSLAACGSDETPTPAAPAPAATTAAAAAAPSDEAICTELDKVAKAMSKDLVAMLAAGEPKPAEAKKVLTDVVAGLTKAAGSSDTEVGAATKELIARSSAAAAAADPMTAIEQDAQWEKAGTDINAACQKAGVTIKF